jgi:hypothetical protein
MAGQLTIDTLRASSGVLATQNGMTGIAKAWVNFAGSTGTIPTNGSFNVSSVTRNATGSYTVNFTTAMPNANYAVGGSWLRSSSVSSNDAIFGVTALATGSVSISTVNGVATAGDGAYVGCIVFSS